jgi:8-oxo-dGTP pyrophosphatase MutT (NUDIX family)
MMSGEAGDGRRSGAWALRSAVRAAIEDHAPADERERRSRSIMLAALDLLPHPFDRDQAQTHITASAVIRGRRGTVLHLHKRTGTWLQPGGHLEPGEPPWDAALRESLEETGLTLRHAGGCPVLLQLDVHPANPQHVHLDLRYLLDAEDGDPRPPAGESQAVRWFTWDEAMQVADRSLAPALRAVRERHAETRTTRTPQGPYGPVLIDG